MSLCIREGCGNEFDVPSNNKGKRYCSRSCAAIVNNVKYPKRRPEGSCAVCGGPATSGRRNCAEHKYFVEGKTPIRLRTPEELERSRISYNAKMRDYNKSTYRERKQVALELLGGVCESCGTSDSLEFDHVDPEFKFSNLTSMVGTWKWEKVLAELDKCQLLCHDCHVTKTRENRDVLRGRERKTI